MKRITKNIEVVILAIAITTFIGIIAYNTIIHGIVPTI
jgi:hypothetical protein